MVNHQPASLPRGLHPYDSSLIKRWPCRKINTLSNIAAQKTCALCADTILNTKGFPSLYACQGFNACNAQLGREAPGSACGICVCVCVCVQPCVSCVCGCVRACIKRRITCSEWWVIHRLACRGAAGWLVEGVGQETHQLCTAELETPVRFMQDSDFLVNWCLICTWLQSGCLHILHAVLLWKPPHTLQSAPLTGSFTPH